MRKKVKNVSLQTKILGIVVCLILTIIIALVWKFLYLDTQRVYESKSAISLQTAKTVSFMPSVKEAMGSAYPPLELQPLTETIRNQADAKFVIITDRNGKILTHPDPKEIYQFIPIDDSYKAVVFGGYYTIKSRELVGPALVGKAPIFNEIGQVIGVVNVGYLIEDIYFDILKGIKPVVHFAIVIVIMGVIVSIFLARNIRNDTLGLEPRQIASLYRDRNATLSSINEGIISVDYQAHITLINTAAKRILNLKDNLIDEPFNSVIPNINIEKVLKMEKDIVNKELFLEDKVIILNVSPIVEGKKVFGAVATFRDKTEIQEMVNTLSEVRKYSEDLRAQAHEFTNKLYAVSGLIQLGYQEDAIKMIQKETEDNENSNRIVFDQINDPKVQAILLGKIGKASEKKIQFTIDENSSLGLLPDHIDTIQLSIIIGNLIDNAFEEVMKKEDKKVSFFSVDLSDDIIIEVTDSGNGIPDEKVDLIFKQGFSTKTGKNRGYGLANAERVVKELNGTIVMRCENPGTTFTIYIPKNLIREGQFKND
ncbi:sensor histidine kinase [Alkalihalobacillus sp. BA299]|uniref:ATP-binding protein n=1 Tax=Alkalihalobacillus sp. BA299 TaxID=2815938 RepID=UPI001AD9DB50|nr:sensor histidine kinase [Alkalihalobacillus sp. BA299]